MWKLGFRIEGGHTTFSPPTPLCAHSQFVLGFSQTTLQSDQAWAYKGCHFPGVGKFLGLGLGLGLGCRG